MFGRGSRVKDGAPGQVAGGRDKVHLDTWKLGYRGAAAAAARELDGWEGEAVEQQRQWKRVGQSRQDP